MQIPLVMTIIGPDRPGLVELLAGLVVEHGGNWLESRMSHLGGHFAGILRILIPAERQEAFVKALRSIDPRQLTVVVHADESLPQQPVETLARLEIVGHDRPGIVRQISQALSQYGVNVEELHTECESAPMSGETLFKAKATLHIPASCKVSELRARLEKIAQDLMVDFSFQQLH
ncbi:MAG: amino acid-binding domain protein [Verrucomicrobiales bacterium]|nr:amino acid-binding domain protein [Verrucomicrobiales bacterium]